MKYFMLSIFFSAAVLAMKEEESVFSKVIPYKTELKIDLNNVQQISDEAETLRDLISDCARIALNKEHDNGFLDKLHSLTFKILHKEKDVFYELCKILFEKRKEDENLYALVGLSQYLDSLIYHIKEKKNFIIINSYQSFSELLSFQNKNKPTLSLAQQVIDIEAIAESRESILIQEVQASVNDSGKYKNLEKYIKKLMKKGKPNIVQNVKKTIQDAEYYLFEQYGFLNERDYRIIIEDLLDEDEILDGTAIDTKCFFYMQREKTAIENKFQNAFFKNHIHSNERITYYQDKIYAADHLLANVSFTEKRKESRKSFFQIFKNFFKQATSFDLVLNLPIKKSLTALINGYEIGDEFIRGFYASIFESNKTKEDIAYVIARFNEIEGCTDCSKIFAYTLKDLDKSGKGEVFLPGSLEALKNDIYVALAEKRLQIFNEYMIQKKIYPYINEEQRYSYSIVMAYFSELFGLNNITDAVWYACDYGVLGKEIVKNEETFINHFFSEYNEITIKEIAYKIMKEGSYDKEVQRYIGMKKFFENYNIVPEYYEKDNEYIVKDTAYMDTNYQLTPLAIEETMHCLFGFSNVIQSGL